MARYFVRFRHSDVGLTPTFTFFVKASDLSSQSAPTVTELQSGDYYFDYTPTFDVRFELDGGAIITDEAVRYIPGTLSPRDEYLDKAVSAVPVDVWALARAAHATTGDMGETLKILHLIHRGHVKINSTTNQLDVYNEADSAVEFSMDLKDLGGLPTSSNPTERIP